MTNMNHFIPLSIPNMEGNEKEYVNDALNSTFISTVGSYTTKLEESLEFFLKVPNVAVCQSGTSALHLAMIQAGIKPGDVVLVPPITFIAAVNPIKYLLAKPVFIDCDDSLCIDPIKLNRFCEEQCTFSEGSLIYKGDTVKAVVVVHVFGNMADMESIMDIAEKYHFDVIEDATEALGTKYIVGKYKGKYAGTIGDYGCYSFNGNKIITTGGGGAITSKYSELVNHIRYLSTQAKDDPNYYIHNEVGYNYRMTNIQAAIGVAQMEELPEFIRRKQKNYDYYKNLFVGFEYGYLMPFRKGTDSNKWFYSLNIDMNKVKATLRDIITMLQNQYNIGTRAIWGLINEQVPYKKYDTYMIEKASYYANRILNIPCSTNLSEEDIMNTVNACKETLTFWGGIRI